MRNLWYQSEMGRRVAVVVSPMVGLFLVVLFASTAFAQQMTFSSQTRQHDTSSISTGRDFRLAIAQNYENQPGKYFALYVSSPVNTLAHVQLTNAAITALPITANKVTSFTIPLSWEMKTSSIVENKGIHVWSDDADLSVFCMLHNPYTSDGTQIFPTQAWGTDYVVAAYGSLYEGSGSFVYDFPSEFTVVASDNNTLVTITPTQDIRGDTSAIALHKKGVPFTETLQAGQSVQYKLTLAQNSDEWDVTGTVIHSTTPVGVIGASQCPNIPMDFPYCDHVCEMIPPIRSWGMKYYTAPFIKRHGGDTFLIIGSSDNQAIYTQDAIGGKKLYAILAKKGDHYFRPDIEYATAWSSNQPFLLMQYMNSGTWPDNVNGDGDPAMMNVPPMESYARKVVIQAPISIGNSTPYTSYLTIATPHGAAKNVTVDGSSLTGLATKYSPDGIIDLYTVGPVKTGTHTIVGDSGVGVMAYGYGYDESYAWAVNQSELVSSPTTLSDTIAPLVNFANGCKTTALVTESQTGAAGLSSFDLDSSKNMSLSVDPSFVPNSGATSATLTIYPVNARQSGFIDASVYDKARNRTMMHVVYTAPSVIFDHDSLDFIGSSHDTTIVETITITNTGTLPFSLTGSHIDSNASLYSLQLSDTSTLLPGDRRTMTITFKGDVFSGTYGQLLVGGPCIFDTIQLLAGPLSSSHIRGGNIVFDTITLGDTSWRSTTLTVLGNTPYNVDSIWTDSPDFYFDAKRTGVAFPFQIQVGTPLEAWFKFIPRVAGPRYGTAFIHSPESSLQTINLSGNLFTSTVRATGERTVTSLIVTASPNPLLRTRTDKLILSLDGIPVAEYSAGLYDMLGQEIRRIQGITTNAGVSTISFDVRDIPAGTYIYRVESVGVTQSGRVVIE